MTVYDTDNSTVIGTTNISRTSLTIIIPAPTNGKVNRLYNAAKTAIGKTMVLYCEFTNSGTSSDGVYYIYDDGATVEVAQAGMGLWIPKTQLGVAWIGTSQIAVARDSDGYDMLEIYNYNGTVTFDHLVTKHLRSSNGTNYYRTARPMIDNNNKAMVYFQGYFNPDTYTDFTTDVHIYDLANEEILL
jgi:hypothetical protein